MDIRDIARLSGYSVGTVSRAINDKPNVSEKAKARIQQVMREQGYQPNPNAQHLKQSTRTSIGVLVKGAHNQLFAELVEHVQASLGQVEEESQLVYLDEDADEVAEAVRYQSSLHFKGILFLGGDPANFRAGFEAITIPCLLLTNTAESIGRDNLSSFTTDDAKAAAEAVDELVRFGHRRIGIIGGNRRPEQIGTLRLQGAMDALERHGVPFEVERDYEPCRFSMRDGYDATMCLLRRRPDLTAIFALGDVMAIGAMRALRDVGRPVPESISVVGFDGIEASKFTVPRLMTVRQDVEGIAEKGVAALLERLEDPAKEPVHERVGHTLHRGESLWPPPHDIYHTLYEGMAS